MVKCWPFACEDLSSTSRTTKKKNVKERRKELNWLWFFTTLHILEIFLCQHTKVCYILNMCTEFHLWVCGLGFLSNAFSGDEYGAFVLLKPTLPCVHWTSLALRGEITSIVLRAFPFIWLCSNHSSIVTSSQVPTQRLPHLPKLCTLEWFRAAFFSPSLCLGKLILVL